MFAPHILNPTMPHPSFDAKNVDTKSGGARARVIVS